MRPACYWWVSMFGMRMRELRLPAIPHGHGAPYGWLRCPSALATVKLGLAWLVNVFVLVLYWLWCMHGCVEPVMWQAQDGAGGRYAEAGELHGLVAGHGSMLAVMLDH